MAERIRITWWPSNGVVRAFAWVEDTPENRAELEELLTRCRREDGCKQWWIQREGEPDAPLS